MKNNVIRYEVYNQKGKWMGSYDTSYNKKNQPTAFEMARINALSHLGSIVAVCSEGLSEEVVNLGSPVK